MSGDIRYSVIIPVYNAEKTIERCLKSLTDQNRQDVEIIVVNDGSNDDTASVIKRYADKNSSIIYVSQENSGVSVARNKGIDYASGIYITFVDSDDYVTEDYFRELDNMENDVDLCYFQRNIIGGKQIQETELFSKINASKEWIEKMELLLSSRIIMHPVNKRFKRQIIEEKQLRFIKNLHISEDFNFCLAYSMYSNHIKVYNSKIYCVDITNENSLSRKVRPTLTDDIVRGFHYAATTIRISEREEYERNQLLKILDYLYVKNVCSCIAETFKYKKPNYIKNHADYQKICNGFKENLGGENIYCNIVHRWLRVFLEHNLVFPFYIVTWLAKGHKLRKYRGK